MKDRKQIKVLQFILVILGLVMLYAAIAVLPQLVDFSIETYREIAYLAKPVNVLVLISAFPFFVVLLESFFLTTYILSDDIYTAKPLKSLNIVAISSITILVLFIIITILFLSNDYFTPLLAVILFLVIISSLVIAVFSRILYILVKKATILKEDNDLTIWGEWIDYC